MGSSSLLNVENLKGTKKSRWRKENQRRRMTRVKTPSSEVPKPGHRRVKKEKKTEEEEWREWRLPAPKCQNLEIEESKKKRKPKKVKDSYFRLRIHRSSDLLKIWRSIISANPPPFFLFSFLSDEILLSFLWFFRVFRGVPQIHPLIFFFVGLLSQFSSSFFFVPSNFDPVWVNMKVFLSVLMLWFRPLFSCLSHLYICFCLLFSL